MVLLTSPPLLLLLLTSTASCTFTKDASRKISVVELASGRLEVVAGHRVSARVVAWATLEDEQGERLEEAYKGNLIVILEDIGSC